MPDIIISRGLGGNWAKRLLNIYGADSSEVLPEQIANEVQEFVGTIGWLGKGCVDCSNSPNSGQGESSAG